MGPMGLEYQHGLIFRPTWHKITRVQTSLKDDYNFETSLSVFLPSLSTK